MVITKEELERIGARVKLHELKEQIEELYRQYPSLSDERRQEARAENAAKARAAQAKKRAARPPAKPTTGDGPKIAAKKWQRIEKAVKNASS